MTTHQRWYALGGAVLLAGSVIGALAVTDSIPGLAGGFGIGSQKPSEAIERNEAAVVARLVELNGMEQAWSRDGKGYVTPIEIAVMVSHAWGASLPVDRVPGRGSSYPLEGTAEADGYRIRYSLPEDRSSYTITATPLEYGTTGLSSFLISEDGVVRGGDVGGREATRDDREVADLAERLERARRIESDEAERYWENSRRVEEELRSSVKLGKVTYRLGAIGAGLPAPVSPRVTLLIDVDVRTPGTYAFDVVYRTGHIVPVSGRERFTRELGGGASVVEVDLVKENVVWRSGGGRCALEIRVAKPMSERELYGRGGGETHDWHVTEASVKLDGLETLRPSGATGGR